VAVLVIVLPPIPVSGGREWSVVTSVKPVRIDRVGVGELNPLLNFHPPRTLTSSAPGVSIKPHCPGFSPQVVFFCGYSTLFWQTIDRCYSDRLCSNEATL